MESASSAGSIQASIPDSYGWGCGSVTLEGTVAAVRLPPERRDPGATDSA